MNAHSKNDPKDKLVNDDYLWDRSGAPDPEIQRLESLLSEFRHADRALVFPTEPPAEMGKSRGLLQFPWLPRLAAAAVVLLAFGLSIFFVLHPTIPPDTGVAWDVSAIDGTPEIGSQTITAANPAAKFHVGQTLITNSTSSASISENDLGEIRVDPNSRVRLLQSGPNHKRIQLEVGTIHAAIWAPPTEFIVDTPSASAIDLGCAYTLQVAPDGSGTIRTTLGWVGFHLNGRDSFIPAGAMCSTRPGVGPGTPCFEDASESFREALHTFDLDAQPTDASHPVLDIVLAEARSRDALTLWHLLSRTSGRERAQVYDRLAALLPPPPGVTRDGILQLDPHMLDLYWNALGLGDISVWRFWEHSSPPRAFSRGESSSPRSSPSSQQLQNKNFLPKKDPSQ